MLQNDVIKSCLIATNQQRGEIVSLRHFLYIQLLKGWVVNNIKNKSRKTFDILQQNMWDEIPDNVWQCL